MGGQGPNHWIRFAARPGTQILDRNRRVVSFGPGAVFAPSSAGRRTHGMIISRIDICAWVAPGELSDAALRRPGGEILLKIEGLAEG